MYGRELEWCLNCHGVNPMMNVFVVQKRLRYEHPKYEAMKTSLVMLCALLRTAMAVTTTEEEVAGFKGSATEYADWMRANFVGYTFFNYEHVLICHAWEFLEKHGTLGAYSSILCEAFNAVWTSSYTTTREAVTSRRACCARWTRQRTPPPPWPRDNLFFVNIYF